jgi:MoaA/NifB/PqqE/SkfB family radical SAM enzyme
VDRSAIIGAWGRVLAGRRPNLSIEITHECPLRCPGCYAYGEDHLGGGVRLRQLADYQGQALIDGVMAAVRRHKPIHLSIVGGEPLVRFRELDVLLPMLTGMGIHTQVVTSAVRPIPAGWAGMKRLQICVSVDGLRPEHDARRAPATYDRILKHIQGQQVTIHCTVTRQQARPGYVTEFTAFWAAQPDVKRIWFSLYTPQRGEVFAERLRPEDRRRVVAEIRGLADQYPKVRDMRPTLLEAYLEPPGDPAKCVFARSTACVSSDLKTAIAPCQFGGHPECRECGCMASAALDAVARHRVCGVIRVGALFSASERVGRAAGWARHQDGEA